MRHLESTIPAFLYCTNVTYAIVAEDYAGNIIATEGYEHQYRVVPEFPSFIILPSFMITTLLAVMLYKKKTHLVSISKKEKYILD